MLKDAGRPDSQGQAIVNSDAGARSTRLSVFDVWRQLRRESTSEKGVDSLLSTATKLNYAGDVSSMACRKQCGSAHRMTSEH
jgi:hypothetical protein